ncbi:MAG: type II toxin-antitoxin system RelE/ParE family toxin [Thermoanaerobaculia bacterium]|nr:type II toxin-antitoxin system RelE/ParE family toxin [Thermoanaerobaculia bacterium]
MAYEIYLTEDAKADYLALDARWRSAVKKALEAHLRHRPEATSKSRIKRLRGLRKPQFRLRVDEIRVFYDIGDDDVVTVLAIVPKSRAESWLSYHGERDHE